MIWYLNGGGRSDSLGDATLAGARQTDGRVCLDVAGDFSGSMEDNVETRSAALALLKPFMAREMRPDDLLTTVAFARTASLTLAPTRAADLAEAAGTPGDQKPGQYTYFAPALKALDRGHGEGGGKCVRRVLVAITDGEFSDDVNELVPLIHHFDRVYLAVPDQAAGYRPVVFADARLTAVVTEGFDDAEALSLLYGKALAAATGQRLVHR
ncbi:vWA domain-containing protein [Nonomuraea sp. NPDC049480]|uniref:vWA domain-containing protein n=1 Tax=Nonomuraea sp. NPDC049480 TaxID=3364353 RepID=UPI0037AE2D5D